MTPAAGAFSRRHFYVRFNGLAQYPDVLINRLNGGGAADGLHLPLDVFRDLVDFRAKQILCPANNDFTGNRRLAVLAHGHSIHTAQPVGIR